MHCMSCNTEIPPNWVACIQRNECPACGKEIMNEQSKELLDELRSAMEEMPNDPEGLAGWLLSNYHISKVGDGQPVNFYGRQPVYSAAHQIVPGQQPPTVLPPGLKVKTDNPVHKFLKNAGAGHLINQSNLPSQAAPPRNVKDLVNHIHNSIQAEEAAVFDDKSFMEDHYIEEDGGYDDPYGGYAPRLPAMGSAAAALANNSLLGGEGGPPPSAAEKAALISALGGPSAGAGQNLHPALAADRAKRMEASANVDLGVGKIRRSS